MIVTNKKRLFILFALLVVLGSCSGNKKEPIDDKTEINSDFLSTVETVEAILNRQTETLTINGKVDYDPGRVMHYHPLIDGIVEKAYFSNGDKVKQGQTLLDVRSADLSALQSELSTLLAEIKTVEREMNAAQEMFEDNMLSEKELLETEAKLKQTEAALIKVQQDMRLFGSDKGDGLFSLKASMSGYIVNKSVSSGSTISSGGESLYTIVDLNTVWVIAHVYAGDLRFVSEGMSVTFTALSYPDEIFEGQIDQISQVFDPNDKVLKARIVMPNPELKLKPEMSVVINLNKKTDIDVITIPSDALIFDHNRYFVVVKNYDNSFEIREVVLQGHDSNSSFIQVGLTEGEHVVIKGQLLLYSALNEE